MKIVVDKDGDHFLELRDDKDFEQFRIDLIKAYYELQSENENSEGNVSNVIGVIIKRLDSRGRIVLPKEWRDKFDTDEFVLVLKENKIEVYPNTIKSHETSGQH